MKSRAKKLGRGDNIKFAVSSLSIVKETEVEAMRLLQEIQGKADKEAIAIFGDAVKQAGSRTDMWVNSTFEDLEQYNDGFNTKLICTMEQIEDRILLSKSLGISIVLLALLHYKDYIENYGELVLRLVRKLEKTGRGKNSEDENARTDNVYRARKVETC